MDPLEFLLLEYKNKMTSVQEVKLETNIKMLNFKTPEDIPFHKQSQLISVRIMPHHYYIQVVFADYCG